MCSTPTVLHGRMYVCEHSQGSYFVFLHLGCSLEKPTQTVDQQANLTSKISRVSPEKNHNGVLYYATEIDDADLDAVRTNIVTDKVDCDRVMNSKLPKSYSITRICDLDRPCGKFVLLNLAMYAQYSRF